MDECLQKFVTQAPMQIGRDHSRRTVHAGGAMDVHAVPLLEHAFEGGHTGRHVCSWARLKSSMGTLQKTEPALSAAVGSSSIPPSVRSSSVWRLRMAVIFSAFSSWNSSSTRGSEPTARLGKTQVYFIQRHHNPEGQQNDPVTSPWLNLDRARLIGVAPPCMRHLPLAIVGE